MNPILFKEPITTVLPFFQGGLVVTLKFNGVVSGAEWQQMIQALDQIGATLLASLPKDPPLSISIPSFVQTQ